MQVATLPIAHVINPERLIRDKDDRHVSIGAGAVLHDFAFGKPDEAARTVRAVVRHEVAFQDEHAVAAGVSVGGIDGAGRVADSMPVSGSLKSGFRSSTLPIFSLKFSSQGSSLLLTAKKLDDGMAFLSRQFRQ